MNKSRGDFFIYVDNNSDVKLSLNISFIKNTVKTPIEIGIRKVVKLAKEDYSDFFYILKDNQTSFEIQLELKSLGTRQLKEKASNNMDKFLEVFILNNN